MGIVPPTVFCRFEPYMVGLTPFCLPIPWRDPFVVFAPHAHRPGAAFLYGGEAAILGLHPTARISGGFAEMAEALATRPYAESPSFGPFGGGAIGYFGYELGGEVEHLPPPAISGPSLPNLAVALFDAVVVFDLCCHRAAVVASGHPEVTLSAWNRLAQDRAAALVVALGSAPAAIPQETWAESEWTADWSPSEYEHRIRQTLDKIHAGDIFQANIAQRFTAPRPSGMSAYGLFRRLCRDNPAP
ncbi:MAG: chorismate-binding protein, partial [Rhodospirillaceae bacterium]|nr:chorismate-binding protein [Rhodospirillaceae bacterium]